MNEDSLDAISICDDAAGVLDDLVVFSRGKLIAHQIKSQTYPKPFRFVTEFIDNCLIAQIAESWQQLRNQYPEHEIEVNYIVQGYASTNDKSKLDDVGHSAEFFAFLASNRGSPLTKSELQHSDWKLIIKMLLKASGLSEDDFFDLFNSLRIYDNGELIRREAIQHDNQSARKVRQIKHLLPELVAKNTRGEIWTEQQLLDQLDWSRVGSVRANHNFPLQDDVQANQVTEEKLLHVLQNTLSGYISLIGPPGTGKSTTLQRAIYNSSELGVARYLAFSPDHRHGLGRAEADDFLNDITIALSKLGISHRRFLEGTELRDQFLNQLQEAGQLYKESGQKTLLIIDGLDHIQREENPQKNLLSMLPLPNTLPKGVLILLGTQFLELEGLSPSITKQASAEGRCVEMMPLSSSAVAKMVEHANLPNYVDAADIFAKSEGHPLVVKYYIESLSHTTAKEEAEAILSSNQIGTNIEEIYSLVWGAINPDAEARHVLGLLARVDNSISPQELAEKVSVDAVERVNNIAGFLLSIDPRGDWSIFHNSFRLFVSNETQKKFGRPDPSLETFFNSQLAEISKNCADGSEQRWLELRYRARAGDFKTVRDISTPDLFRDQLKELRSPKDVYLDLRLAYGAIEDSDQVDKLVQLLLVEKEIDYRVESISRLDLVDIYQKIGEQDRAYEMALSTGVESDGVFELIDQLYAKGDKDRARKLFDQLEPVEHFYSKGTNQIHGDDFWATYSWFERAPMFRGQENVLPLISAISERGNFQRDPTENLKYVFVRGMLKADPFADIKLICQRLNLDREAELSLLFVAVKNSLKVSESSATLSLISELLEARDEISGQMRRACAEISLTLGNTSIAKDFLSDLKIEPSQKFRDYEYGASIDGLMDGAFRQARTSEHLGLVCSINDADLDEYQNNLLSIPVRLGRLASKLSQHKKTLKMEVVQELEKACSFIAFAKAKTEHFSNDLLSASSLTWLARAMVRIAALHSNEALHEFEELVQGFYDRGSNRISRLIPFRAPFATEVYKIDGDRAKAISRIMYLEPLIKEEYTSYSAVEMRSDLVTALAEVDAIDEAKFQLSKFHDDAFGYWLAAKKEPQYVFWREAYARACKERPQEVGEYAKHFSQFVIGLEDTEGSDTGARIVKELLSQAVAAPQTCAGIIRRLVDSNLTSWADLCAATLSGIASFKPSLAYECALLYSKLVLPFRKYRDDNSIDTIYGLLSDEQRAAINLEFEVSARIYADLTHELTILEKLKKLSEDKEGEISIRLERVKGELEEIKGVKASQAGSRTSRDVEEAEIKKIERLSELALFSDGLSSYSDKSVDYLYARRATELIEDSTEYDLISFIDKRPIILENADFVINACARFIDFGNQSKVDETYSLSEKLANKGSWSSWYGGEKIALQKLRLKREGIESLKVGFSSLISDLSSGRTSSQMIIGELHEVVNLLAPDANWSKIWHEVQQHLQAYREFSLAAPIEEIDDISSPEDLIYLLFRQGFSYFIEPLTVCLREGLLLISSENKSSGLLDLIIEKLRDDEKSEREVAWLLWRLAHQDHLKDVVSNHAQYLLGANDAVVVQFAKFVLSRLGVEFQVKSQPLPPFYRFADLDDERAESFDLPAGVTYESSFWLEDPWYWTTAAETPIKLISKASNLSVEIIRRRCAEKMRTYGGKAAFGPPAEEKLKISLDNLNLRYNYLRLMPRFAIKAVGEVLEELIRASQIDFAVLPYVWSSLGAIDPLEVNFALEPRPEWIEPATLPPVESWSIQNEDWLNFGPSNTIVPVFNEWFILGEAAEFVFSGDWQKLRSVRTSMPKSEWESRVSEGLEGLPRMVAYSDPCALKGGKDNALICRASHHLRGTLREEVMTISERVVQELEYKRSRDNPLIILDKEGLEVAKTIIWNDGLGYPSKASTERSGHGHVLLIKKESKNAFEDRYGGISISTRVSHEFSDREHNSKRVFHDGQMI